MTNPDDAQKQGKSSVSRFSLHTETRGISSHRYPSYTSDKNTSDYMAFLGEATSEATRWRAFRLIDRQAQLRRCVSLLSERCWNEQGNLSFVKLLQLRRAMTAYQFEHLKADFAGTLSLDPPGYIRYGKDEEEARLIKQSGLSAAWAHYCDERFSAAWLAGSAVFALLADKNEFAFGFLTSELDQKLRNENDAMRGKKTLAGAASGGATRSRENSAEKRKRLEKMRSFIAKGHSVHRAAQLTHSSGLGVSAEANKKLWTRNTRK